MSYEDAVKAVQITSISNAVERMEHITNHSSINDSLVSEAKHIQLLVKGMGGMCWINEWDGDVAPSGDVSVPQKWRDIRGGTSVRTWPIAQSGSIVTHNEKQWQVVVNFVYGGNSGRYVEVFSIYAIIPA